jgi:hypothetical protein
MGFTILLFGRAVSLFVLCYSHDRFIQIHVLQKEFENIKGVITSGILKKDRQHNDQKKIEQTHTTQRTKD